MWKLFMLIDRLNRDERGATIVEYGVALVIVTGVGAAVLGALATDVFNSFTAAEAIM